MRLKIFIVKVIIIKIRRQIMVCKKFFATYVTTFFFKKDYLFI